MAREPPAMVTKEDIVKALMGVKDPEIGASIVDLGMVRSTEIQGDTVRVDIALTVPNCPHSSTIRDNVITAVSAFPGVNRVEVQLSGMTDEERENVVRMLKNRPAAEQSEVQQTWHSSGHGIDRLPKGKIRQVIAVASGKGGVGKSLVKIGRAHV